MSKILCVYPDDPTTRFLNRLQMGLKNRYKNRFHCYKIKPNDYSHSNCLTSIAAVEDDDLILYLGHGRSNYLFGSKGKTSHSLFQNLFIDDEHNDQYYEKEVFINSSNIHVFSKKKVICLSCNSKDLLDKLYIQSDAQVFVGFGDIPTDPIILKEVNRALPNIIARFKGELNWIMRRSLFIAIHHNMNFYEYVDTIKYLTNKRIKMILVNHPNLGFNYILADYLFNFKDEIKIFGDGTCKVLK